MFVLFDGAAVAGGYVLALALRFDGRIPAALLQSSRPVILGLAPVYVGANLLLHVYWRGWRYAGLRDALALVEAASLATGVALVADVALGTADRALPLSVIPVGGLFALVMMGLARFGGRICQEMLGMRTTTPQSRTLVIGAGRAGQRLARELLSIPGLGYRPVCFIDDDPEKRGQRIHGLPVAGTRNDVLRLVRQHRIEVIVVAIPSLTAEERRGILARCEDTPARIKIVPGLPELLTGQFNNVLFRDARLEDLLGRRPVAFPRHAHQSSSPVQSVLITGAAGSIGSELARQVAASGPGTLVLLDTNESGLFDLAAELQAGGGADVNVRVAVADVTRARRLQEVLASYRPTIVFHAAAYKHVPLMEEHPREAVITNVLGTLTLCIAAEANRCERVVFISTDKAVAPASVMGATKRVGEHIIRAFSGNSRTVFCAVRFGNVLGSRGSVVPTFTRQIREGGPITITHAEATRFFMTLPEAASLIIEAGYYAEGGEIFILDMGQRVRILDLARKMIRLQGLRPEQDIQIQEIGLRPGERIHEALVTNGEELIRTVHPRVCRVQAKSEFAVDRADLLGAVDELGRLAELGSTKDLVASLFGLAEGPVSGSGAVNDHLVGLSA